MSEEIFNHYRKETSQDYSGALNKAFNKDGPVFRNSPETGVVPETFSEFMKKVVFLGAKRCIDITWGLIGSICFVLLYPILGPIIKIDSEGPVLFRQKRLGKDGKPFFMLKFRSMEKDAEKIKPLIFDKNEVKGPMFKIVDDPRLTRIGRFLRRRKLDELPQFWNILKGEMTLVGPRPLADEEMRFDAEWREERLKVKQGLTGLWQVENRDYRSFEEWIYWDEYYVKNRSFALDMKIIGKTILLMGKSILPSGL